MTSSLGAKAKSSRSFCLEGQIRLEQPERQHGEIKLAIYAFNDGGILLGCGELDREGQYSLTFRHAQQADITVYVGPAGMAEQIRLSSAYQQKFSIKDWKTEGAKRHLKFDAVLPPDTWMPWWPLRICISGHVRKVSHRDGFTDINPVPYTRVEIFEVDREGCLWSPISKWCELLLDKPVIRMPDLLNEPPFQMCPLAGCLIPVPNIKLDAIEGVRSEDSAKALEKAELNQQHPRSKPGIAPNAIARATQDSLSDVPSTIPLQQAYTRVGEVRLIDNGTATRLDRLTVTSKVAPWLVFPHCYHSKAELGETTTDCDGFFNFCCSWWPFLFRQGRLSFDSLPDIIVKVTQTINGVSTEIFLDPYTATRWNGNHAHLDLSLDDDEILCGTGSSYDPPQGSMVHFTRIGDDEVYKIDQTSGLYNNPPAINIGYGSDLAIYGWFGDALPAGARYYRLCYARHDGGGYTPISTPLADTCIRKNTLAGETVALGPFSVNDVPALYELRNIKDYYWYNPDWLCIWQSALTETNTGKYRLRLEVFDHNGVKLSSADGVDYRDGCAVPPAVPDAMPDHCELTITLDNREPEVELSIPGEINSNGVIPMTHGLSLDFQVHIEQENARLRSWGLYYTRGTSPTLHELASGFSNNGLPGNIDQTIRGGTLIPQPGTGMLANLNNNTCAYALKLWATSHVRDGRHFIYYREQIKVFVVEKFHIEAETVAQAGGSR